MTCPVSFPLRSCSRSPAPYSCHLLVELLNAVLTPLRTAGTLNSRFKLIPSEACEPYESPRPVAERLFAPTFEASLSRPHIPPAPASPANTPVSEDHFRICDVARVMFPATSRVLSAIERQDRSVRAMIFSASC